MGYLCGTLYTQIGLYSDDRRPELLTVNLQKSVNKDFGGKRNLIKKSSE